MRFTSVLFLLALTAASPIQRMQTLLVQYFTTVAYYTTIAVDYPEPTTFVSSIVTWAPGPIKTLISTFDEDSITTTERTSYTTKILTAEPGPSSSGLSHVSDFESFLLSKDSSGLVPITSSQKTFFASEVSPITGADKFQDMPSPTASLLLTQAPSAPIFEWDNEENDRQRPIPGSWDDDNWGRQKPIPDTWETADKGQQNRFPEPWEWTSLTAVKSITRSASSENVETDHRVPKDVWENTQSSMGQPVFNDDTSTQSAPFHSFHPKGKPYPPITEASKTTSFVFSEGSASPDPSTKKASFWEPVSEVLNNSGFKDSTSLIFTGKTTAYTTPTFISDSSSEFEGETSSPFPNKSPLGFSSTITLTRRCTKSTATFDSTSTSSEVSPPSAVFSASGLNRHSTTFMDAVKRPMVRSSPTKNFFPFSTLVSIMTSAVNSKANASSRSTVVEPSANSHGNTDFSSTSQTPTPSWDVDSEFPLIIESSSLSSSPSVSPSKSELKVTVPAFTECPCVHYKTRKSETRSSDKSSFSEVTFEPGLTLTPDFVLTNDVPLEPSLTFEESMEPSVTTEKSWSQTMSEVFEVSTIQSFLNKEKIVMSTTTEPLTSMDNIQDSGLASFAVLSTSKELVEAKSSPTECSEDTITPDRIVCSGAPFDPTSRSDLETTTEMPAISLPELLATKTSSVSDPFSSQEKAQIIPSESELPSSGKFHPVFPTGIPDTDSDSTSDSDSDSNCKESDSDSELGPNKCRMLVPKVSQTAELASLCSDICKDVGPSQENCGLEVAANYGGRRVEVVVADRKGDGGSCDLRFSPAECCSTDKKREGRLNFAWNWI